jgi:hypothetical protein
MISVILEKLTVQLSSNLLGIDSDRNHIRILEFSKDHGGAGSVKGKVSVKVLRTISEKIEPGMDVDDGEKLGGVIKEVLRKHRITTTGAVFAVGRERAFWHPLSIPASVEDQVANLVRFQLAQELPFAIEESVVDYVITARNEEGKVTGVLAAAVRTETLNYLQKLARSAGLTIRRVGLRPYANFMAVQSGNLVGEQITLFVDLSLQGLEIDIVSPEGGLIFSRNIGLEESPNEGTVLKDGYLEKAILQMKRTLQAQAYLAGSPSQRPHQAIIAGNTGWEQEFSEMVAMQATLSSRLFELPGEAGGGGGFSAAYGMACGQYQPRQTQFDFLSPKRAVDPQAVRARHIRLGVVALAALMLMAFLYSNRLVADRTKEYYRLAAENKKLGVELSNFKKFSIQVNEVQAWTDREMNWLEQLQKLTELLPSTEQAYFGRIFMAESSKADALAEISLDGQAKSRPVMDAIVKDLAEKGSYVVVPGPQSTTTGEYPENFKVNLMAVKHHAVKKEVTKEKPEITSKKKITPPAIPNTQPARQPVRRIKK